MLDHKGISSYLLITFGLTYAIEAILIALGVRLDQGPALAAQITIAGVMWVPAFATFITVKFITREGFAIARLQIGSWKPYLAIALVLPIAFALVYGMTWALGLGTPDWHLSETMAMMAKTGVDISTAPPSTTIVMTLFFATLFITPLINSVFGFGEELGWRGYLLPKLMVLGKWRAYLALGIIWGLWHAPLITMGFLGAINPWGGILAMIGLTTSLGLLINEFTLRYRSSLLAGWIHGVFNSQSYGIWRLLFPSVTPFLGGMTGVIGLLVWLALGLGAWAIFKNQPPAMTS